MDADRNLLFGVLALQADLIDSRQFIEACTLWTTCKERLLFDLMVERGWLKETDRAHLEYLVERTVQRYQGQPHRSPSANGEIRRSFDAAGDDDNQCSLGDTAASKSVPLAATVNFQSNTTGHYDLNSVHAFGGIGQIWLAHDNNLDRSVALKELRPEHQDNPQTKARFLREAQITGQLQHPGITPIYELGWRGADQRPFYTMRFVQGPTLSEAVAEYHQRRSAGEAEPSELLDLLNAFVAVCNTIAYGHSRDVVHRDIKGQNVVLGDFGEVIVLDWGIAKLLQSSESKIVEPDLAADLDPPGDGLLTVQGQMLGTPAYMAPEQAAGQVDQIDHRTDVYGLGALLYEILTGQPPFSGVVTRELLQKVRHELPQPPRELADVPPPLESACLRALAKNPEDRFASARDLAQIVERWQETQRQAAEEALRTSEALYHSLVETMPMNVWRKDADGRFTFANQGFCQASGRTLEKLLGQTDFDLFPRELAEKYRQDDERVMADGQTLDAIEEHLTGDGDKLFVRVIKLPIRDSQGLVVGTQGIFWDVSEVNRLEVALQEKCDEAIELRRQLRDAVSARTDNEDSPSQD